MATLDERLRAAFLADAGVSALIGNRLYDRQIAQNPPQYPCAAYQRISTIPLYSQEHDSDQASVGWARYQITVWADGPNGGIIAANVAKAFSDALQGFNLWNQPASPVVVQSAPNYILNRRAGIEPNTKQPLFKEFIDIKCWYSEQ